MDKEVYLPHKTVMKKETVDFLTENYEKGCAFFADLTFGGGGHTKAILERSASFNVIAVDQDPDAIEAGLQMIQKDSLAERIALISGNFEKFPEFVKNDYSKIFSDEGGLQGIMMDLGVSCHHFDKDQRGFSFSKNAPLDMRMNNDDDTIHTASEIVNQWPASDLAQIFREYGEERFSERIADKIVEERSRLPITTTKDLENIIFHCYPKKMRFGKTNPSTRCFQALRIAVNQELRVLEDTIPHLLSLLKIGGRLVIISFHSLEDRIVKNSFKKLSKGELACKIITKKPVIASDDEVEQNRRSRSAKLRVLERIPETELSRKKRF